MKVAYDVDFKPYLHDLGFILCGYFYSYLSLKIARIICKNVEFRHNYERDGENEEGRHARISNYVNGIIFYTTTTLMVFYLFNKSEFQPKTLGGKLFLQEYE